MGKLSNGILGSVTNRVGNVVGSTWKGINTVRVYQPNVSNPQSAKQVAARNNMSSVVALASQITSTICAPLWNRFAKKMSGYNDFVSVNIAQYTNGVLTSPAELKIAVGKMIAPVLNGVSFDGATITIEALTVANDPYALPTDEVYLLAMNVGTGAVGFAGKLAVTRAAFEGNTTDVAVDADAQSNYIYVAFRRADGTIVSNSSAIN